MKNYTLYCIIFFFSFFNLKAQIKVNSEVDITNYPSVSFDIHNRNPNFKTEKNYNFFRLSGANEVLIDSVSISKVNDTVNYSKKNKCVLILIESINNPERYEQVNTFFKALNNSLEKFVKSGDKIQIAAFHLRQDNTRILNPLHNSFTDDIKILKNAIKDYDASKNKEIKPVSEIPGAILEGIDLLIEIPVDYNKSILLLSEERTNKYSTQKTFVNVIDIAQDKEIVINSIKYNRSDYRQHTNPVLAAQTYGESHVLDLSRGNLRGVNRKKQAQAEKIISSVMNNVVKRSKGNIGKVTLYFDDVYSDGCKQQIRLKEINSPYNHEFTFDAPGNWYFGQIEKNPLITILISLLLIIVLGLILRKLKSRQQSKKNKLLDEKEKENQIKKKQQTELLSQQKEIESLKELEQQRLDDLNRAKVLKDKKNKEAKLIKEMQALGAFPILKYIDSKKTNSYEINKPSMSVGRDESNDIHILNPSISRTHFTIIFEASNYTILDNESTNGMIINGYKLKKSTLKNGDVIEIADATFTFYL